jgi:hypothetical protein
MYPVDGKNETLLGIAVFHPSYRTIADINARVPSPTTTSKNKTAFESFSIHKPESCIDGSVVYTDLDSSSQLKRTQTVLEQTRRKCSLLPSVFL